MACYQGIVDAALSGQRLDAALRRMFPELTSWMVRDAFDHRDVKLNGKRVKADLRVEGGEAVAVYLMETDQQPIDVVYEDQQVLLLNKRPGISVTEDDGGGTTLTELAGRYLRLTNADADNPRPVHRLDNQTSGLILFAKDEESETILSNAFKERLPSKQYTCLVRGMMKPPAATCKAFLLKDAQAARVRIFDHAVPGSKPIATAYTTAETGPISRLHVDLLTGRTHQIRAHLASLGHPILGDDVYGDRAFNRAQRVRKLMLCATTLTLRTGGRMMQIEGRTFSIPCPF